ncbi:MAG: hypothetical protein MUC40_04415 [Akkermansiaceae bacterium]|nr:hypothetical protein [Akkermansiaceae bacterium]
MVGFDLRIVDEQVVHHAAVVGIERAELVGLAGFLDACGDFADLLRHLVLADGAEMLAVHLDALRFGKLPPQDAVHEVLNVIEPVAIAADDGFAVRRLDLEARPVVGFLHLDGGRQAELAEHGVEYPGCCFHRGHGGQSNHIPCRVNHGGGLCCPTAARPPSGADSDLAGAGENASLPAYETIPRFDFRTGHRAGILPEKRRHGPDTRSQTGSLRHHAGRT